MGIMESVIICKKCKQNRRVWNIGDCHEQAPEYCLDCITGLTAAQRVRAIDFWQNSLFHPLTCGNDSQKHKNLVGVDAGGITYLKCPDCDYEQFYVPGVVYEHYAKLQKLCEKNK